MYVDKKLGGVQCVQTLSRLNRTTKGKENTFVLDFVNETEDILKSFEPYFTFTTLTEETEPDQLYGLVYEIEQYNLYTKQQLEEFCKHFYDKKTKHNNEEQTILNEVVDRFRERLNEEEKETYKSKIQSYCRLYSYISQITSFGEKDWEKTYVFLMFLNKKLPKMDSGRLSLLNLVDLESLRIQLIGTTKIGLVDGVGKVEPISGDGGGGKNTDEEKEFLSEIVKLINSVYGSEITKENKIIIQGIENELIQNTELTKVLMGDNSESSKKDYFKDEVVSCVSDLYFEKYDFYNKLMSDKIFPQFVSYLYETVSKQHRSGR
jgi:type I restriction enzyme R subunit